VALVIAGTASPASGWADAPTLTQAALLALTLVALLASVIGTDVTAVQKK
jgi:hypothetical protein